MVQATDAYFFSLLFICIWAVCCNNHRWAEYRGYLEAPEVDLFSRLDPNEETVFYDSTCGIPLFIAPRGRSFEEFKEESLKHGWPSFRPEEMVSENVIIHNDGRMESRCLTHLGHNLPEGGVDRYCIDLVCVAGQPLSAGDERAEILTRMDASVLDHEELDQETYVSSAETYSGKTSNGGYVAFVGGMIFAAVLLAALPASYAWRKSRRKARETVEEAEEDTGTVASGADEAELMTREMQ